MKEEIEKIDETEDILHTSLLKGCLNSVGSINSDNGSLMFLDFEESKNESVDNLITLKVFKHDFELGEIDIVNKTGDVEIGINTLIQSIEKNVLQEQFIKGEQSFANLTDEIDFKLSLDVELPKPEPIKFLKNPWKWFLNLFKKEVELVWAPGQKEEMQRRKLISKIFSLSHYIAVRGRRGAGNYIITNSLIGAILQDSNSFTNYSHNTLLNGGQPYQIGNIGGVMVYVDPYMSWNDTRVLIGRGNKEITEPGMTLVYNKESLKTIKETGRGTFKYAIINTGLNNSKNYIVAKFDIPNTLI
jgi:hypothetical protein